MKTKQIEKMFNANIAAIFMSDQREVKYVDFKFSDDFILLRNPIIQQEVFEPPREFQFDTNAKLIIKKPNSLGIPEYKQYLVRTLSYELAIGHSFTACLN